MNIIPFVSITKIIKDATGRIQLFNEAGNPIVSYLPTVSISLNGQSIQIDSISNDGIGITTNNPTGIELETPTYPNTSYIGTVAGLFQVLIDEFFNESESGGGGGGGDASAALQQQQLDEAVYQTQFQDLIYQGVGQATDPKILDPNDNASLVSLSKGQLENLALIQEVLGYGSSPIIIDPALGGTISGVLKGILYNVAPPVPTNSYFLNTGALTVGQDFRSLLNASQSRKITGGVFSARSSAGDKMLILFDYQPGGTAPTATDIRAVYVLPSGNHSIQIAPMNFESGIWVLVAQSSNTDNPASLTALSPNHASVSIFHEPTTLV